MQRINTRSAFKKPKKPTKCLKRAPRKKFLFSWKGLEHYKERIHELSKELIEIEKDVKRVAKPHNWSVTGLICSAIRNPTSVAFCGEAVKAGEAFTELRQIQYDLVWKHNLDFDFVRKESATILDPSKEEAELSQRLIERNKERVAERD